jgi:formylglycine-generating enzyme required for sulfatase activity
MGILSVIAGLVVAAPASTNARKVNVRDGLRYIWIPPGASTLGCSPGDQECFNWETPPHEVTIDRGFWIGETEVTQKAYQRVTATNPSRYKGPDLPVEQISWNDALGYCATVGMRLPSEAEWEYAARGGTSSSRYGSLDSIAWYAGNSDDQTHKAGTKAPNRFGLYDTLGNVWEWVQDRHDVGEKQMRILRGGSFYNLAREQRASNRLWAPPETAHRNMGFRCAGS